jgi:hypothetical protein
VRKTLAILGAAVSISMLAACGGSHDNKNPSSLIGEWHQVNKNPDGYMTASIDGDSIQVNLRGRDSSAIFWLGTFAGTHRPVGKFKVVSLRDQDATKYNIASSPDKTKTFTYKNGDLSFDFSTLGSTTTVHLHKTNTVKPTRTITRPPTFNRPVTRTPKMYKPAPTKTIKSAAPSKIKK